MHTMENRGVSSPAFHQPSPEKLLVVFAALISYCTGSLASRLAGALALAAAALNSGSLQVSLVDGCDVLQIRHLFRD